jgi:NAD(P)-dependent dehydrogenase (short-subunit alcohol dehydrogenase family)
MLRKLYYMPRMIDCSIRQFRTKDAPFQERSQEGKVAIISGGNSGIGFECAKALAWQGCEVYILCRNPAKASNAVDQINDHCKAKNSIGSCKALALDLADLESVKRCIEELQILFQQKKIDYFFCNGGIMSQPYSKTPQGYEIHFATNHLGHFALVGGILDLLVASHTRIVVVTGDIAVWADDASPNYVYSGDGTDAYCRSKICNQSFVRELCKRYKEITAYSVHPGVVDSNLFSLPEGTFLHRIELAIRPFIMIDCVKGAQSSLLCALHDSPAGKANGAVMIPNGSYYHNVYGICDYHPTALDDTWSAHMWGLSIQLCKEHNVVLKF